METKNLITVVVNGRYHAFDYAAELYKRGRLGKLISTMPAFVADRYGIGREAYVGMPVLEVIKRIPRSLLHREPPVMWFARTFAKAALRHIPKGTKAIVGLNGFCLEILQSPRFRDTIKIVDRIAAHPRAFQQAQLDAAVYHGTKWKGLPEIYIRREIEEFEAADRVLVASEYVRKTCMDYGTPEYKLWKNLYGASDQKFAGLDNTPLPRKKAILYVGNVTPLKGIGVLVNAMELVRKEVPDAELWLVGPRSRLMPDRVVDKPWVRLFGPLHGQALYDKYRSASVFGFLTFSDGFGLVQMEAARCGLPVVSTPNSGSIDVFPDGEGLVKTGDAEAAARKIVYYLTGQGRRRGVELLPNWSAFASNLIEKVDRLLEMADSPPVYA